MRILFLLTQDLESPSGLGRYAPLARELTVLGHQITIAALHSRYDTLDRRSFFKEGVDVRYLAPMHVKKRGNLKIYYTKWQLFIITAKATWSLINAACRIPSDIVFICKPHPMNSIAGLVVKILFRRQVYLDCDDYEAAVGNFEHRWQQKVIALFENRVPRHVDCITTNTWFTHNRLVNLGLSPNRIIYLSNGVDPTRFTPPPLEKLEELRAHLDLHGKKIVVFVGSLSRPSHPVDLLIQSFKEVHQVLPNSALLIVGGGDDFDRLSREAHRIGLANSIIFCGRIQPTEVPLYYHLADVSVDPIYDDNAARGRSPLKLFESWACGVPFVTASVGDRLYLMGDPPAGVLIQPGNPTALASAIIKILTDPKYANILAQRGLERVKSFYWDKLALQFESLCLKNRRLKKPTMK